MVNKFVSLFSGLMECQENPYPVHINIQDVRECIKGCSEFFEKREEDLIIFNYRYCNQKTFPTLEGVEGRERLLRQLKRFF